MRSSRPPARAQFLVGLLYLRESPRGLFRTAVAVGMVQLDESPVSVMQVLGGRFRRDPEEAAWIAPHSLNLTECRGRPECRTGSAAPASHVTADQRPRRAEVSGFSTKDALCGCAGG
jgi:hypothetical protein